MEWEDKGHPSTFVLKDVLISSFSPVLQQPTRSCLHPDPHPVLYIQSQPREVRAPKMRCQVGRTPGSARSGPWGMRVNQNHGPCQRRTPTSTLQIPVTRGLGRWKRKGKAASADEGRSSQDAPGDVCLSLSPARNELRLCTRSLFPCPGFAVTCSAQGALDGSVVSRKYLAAKLRIQEHH